LPNITNKSTISFFENWHTYNLQSLQVAWQNKKVKSLRKPCSLEINNKILPLFAAPKDSAKCNNGKTWDFGLFFATGF
jgi:hypothetical protein